MKILTIGLFLFLTFIQFTYGQNNTFFLGEKSYPCSKVIGLYPQSDKGRELDVIIAKNGQAGMLVLRTKLYSKNTKIYGKILIYLEDNTVITCIDRGIYDYVDNIATTVYSLTNSEISKMHHSNISSIRFSVKCPTCIHNSEDGAFLVYNKDNFRKNGYGYTGTKKTDTKQLIAELWNMNTPKTDTQVTIQDIDGNVYHSIKIGNQFWMSENLRTTKFRKGENIPKVTDGEVWSKLSTSAYCSYNNNNDISSNNGYFYNWYTISDSRMLCPEGWHIPSNEEWMTLINNLGGENNAGLKLREENFQIKYGGHRFYDGSFGDLRNIGSYWTSTQYNNDNAWAIMVKTSTDNVKAGNINKESGFSVRCIKD
jgi:uncharacterized protein (TIGR02145 family)